MYPQSKIKQRSGDELKCVYVGQDLTMYDDLFEGFSHHFLQPCYIEGNPLNGMDVILPKQKKWSKIIQDGD